MKSLLAVNVWNAGLGNRIRFTLSAEMLANYADRHFQYVWPTDAGFKAELNDLWEYDAECVGIHRSKDAWATVPLEDDTVDFLSPTRQDDPLWHIRSANDLALPDESPSWQDRFRELVPVVDIAERVERWRAEMPASYVGVQIRAHAEQTHQKTLEASPIEWYLNRMRQIQREEKDTTFFLSCDVPEVQDRIASEIPNCHGLVGKGEYNTLAALKSSVVDLYLLAGSRRLVGPHWSTFVQLAWELAGRRVTLETSRKIIAG